MNFKHLRHIVTLADMRNFARAAGKLHISQPALTRSIQAVEAAWGLRLFDRGTVEVTLTPAGQFMLERARRLLFDGHCLERDLALYRNRIMGDVAFGVGPTPASSFLAGVLTAAINEHAGIAFRVAVGNWELLLSQLRSEEIEFFVADIRDLPANAELHILPFRSEAGGFYVRTGHPLASGGEIEFERLWAYGVASVRMPAAVARLLSRMQGPDEADALRIRLECDDVGTLIRVAQGTDLVLAAVHVSVAQALAKGDLQQLAVAQMPEVSTEMGIVTLRGRALSPMADYLVEYLQRMA